MKRLFTQQGLLRTMMMVATLLFTISVQTAWADDVATVTISGTTTSYSSLEAALSAANDASSAATVTLLTDIAEQPCSLVVTKPMIIDLNGHAVKYPNHIIDGDFICLDPGEGQTVTIKNGSVSSGCKTLYMKSGETIIENITVENYHPSFYCLTIYQNGTLTLSQCVSFIGTLFSSGTLQIASGQILYTNDGIASYSGKVEDFNELNNTTLTPSAILVVDGTSTPYNSLEDAVSAANNASSAATITLYRDIAGQPSSLTVTKPMTIDLNGHAVNANSLNAIIYNSDTTGKVTIKNGTMSSSSDGYAISNAVGGNLELENVTVRNTSSTNPCINNDGTLTISKGITLEGNIENNGTVQIAEGQDLYDSNGNKYTGTLTSDQVDALAYNTLFSIITVTVNGTSTPYNSFEDAVSAANNASSAATITLYRDIAGQPSSLTVTKPMTIDLNGHAVNANGLNAIIYNSDTTGKVIIKNGTMSSSSDGYAISNAVGGNLELENVTVRNTSSDNPCINNDGTLTISKGITLEGYIENNGTVQIAKGQLLVDESHNEYYGTLTSAQVAALANTTLSVLAVPYIDADGKGQTCSDYILLTTSNEDITLTSGWYVVEGEVTQSGILSLSGDINIILCDGARLNVPFLAKESQDVYGNLIYNPSGNFAIYGQADDSGSFYSERTIFNGKGNFTVNGGNVTVHDEYFGLGISSGYGAFTVNGGALNISISAQGGDIIVGLYQMGPVVINGGTVYIDAPYGMVIVGNHESRGYDFIEDDDEAGSRPHANRAAPIDLTPKLMMNGGSLTINAEIAGIGGDYDSIDFNGGQMTVLGSTGIILPSVLNLSYTSTSDFFYASNVSLSEFEEAQINVAKGKTFYDGHGNSYSGNIRDRYEELACKTLRPFDYLLLADNSDNTAVIASRNDNTISVVLQDRTLYKDGYWNTVCLPFSMTAEQIGESPLAGAEIRALSSSSLDNDVLTLNFTPATGEGAVTSIEAGVPYLMKWGTPENHPASDLVNPLFMDVTVKSGTTPVETAKANFVGTYSPIVWETDNNTILFLGDHNTLYFPQVNGDDKPHLNACRAYFQLNNGLTASDVYETRINFDENETNGITTTDFTNLTNSNEWYSLDGRKLQAKPTKKGMYINNGRKVIVK